jgi:hypothetical protein
MGEIFGFDAYAPKEIAEKSKRSASPKRACR